LRPVPVARNDDKVLLPPSALQPLTAALTEAGAAAITLEVTLDIPGDTSTKRALTHCGVLEFTAEEGTIAIPPKVALCLAQQSQTANQLLASGAMLNLRYVRLRRVPEGAVASVQPRGRGFHKQGEKVLNIDVKTIFQETLRNFTCLSAGDRFSITHENNLIEFVVRNLTPENAICLVDTDLAIDFLPSEVVEAEMEHQANIEKAKADKIALEEELAKRKVENRERLQKELLEEPAEGLAIFVKMPDGSRPTRKFSNEVTLEHVLNWVASTEAADVASADDVTLVQSWPGHRKEFGTADKAKSLKELGFAPKGREQLFLQRAGDPVIPDVDLESPGSPAPSAPRTNDVVLASDEWEKARKEAEANAESQRENRRLEEVKQQAAVPEKLKGEALVGV
jgi:ubiquitin fusion degradation protein 1